MKTLSPKDLINVGVFTAIYFVVLFSLGMIGLIGPMFMFVGHALGIIANGAVIALYLSRVPKRGALLLLMFVVGILMWMTGHVWYTIIVGSMLGAIGDLVASTGEYRSPQRNAIAYAIVSLGYVVPLLPIIYDSKGYLRYIADSMGQDYADGFATFFNTNTLLIWAVAVVVLAYLGGIFGQSLLRRHFARSNVA